MSLSFSERLSIEAVKNRILDIFLSFGIHEDFRLNEPSTSPRASNKLVLDSFVDYVKEKKLSYSSNRKNTAISSGSPVELDCLLWLICEFHSYEGIYFDSNFVSSLIELFPYSNFNGKTICKLFDVMRSTVRASNMKKDLNILHIPLKYHPLIWTVLNNCLLQDNPQHIMLPGDKESFIQLSGIPITSVKAYTMALWIKIPADSLPPSKGFILFRCRSPISGVDAIISNIQDGMMTLTVRTNSEKKGKDEVQGRIFVSSGQWHLITVKQYTSVVSGNECISVSVDGNLELEHDLKYPFQIPTTDSLWIFGVGLRGYISSITFYPDDIPAFMIQLLYAMGPYIPEITVGVSCPQSSFDSGHVILGTQISKGSISTKACKLNSIFCIKACNFNPGSNLPQISPGRLFPEHIEMVNRLAEFDSPLVVTLQGTATLGFRSSWVESYMEAGGSSLVLYMLWNYCGIKYKVVDSSKAADATSSKLEFGLNCIKKCMTLVGNLIKATADLKEHFIQIHGFHITGSCLSSLSQDVKKNYIDQEIVNISIDLVKSLRNDSVKGDGITAALQGLLFDFRIWGSCSLPTMKYLLDRLSEMMLESASDQLYKSIGIQRILDVFRLYIARVSTSSSKADISLKADHSNSQQQLMEWADAVQRLLVVAMDAAKSFTVKMRTSLSPEAEILLKCLEETNSCLIAERILRVLGNLRLTSQVALIQALISLRYHETTIVSLLTKRGFSIEVRRNALINLFWLLNEELSSLATDIVQHRKSLNSIALTLFSPITTGSSVAKSKNLSHADASRVKTLTSQIRDLVKPLEKAWLTVNMISEVLSRALEDGSWGLIRKSCLSSDDSILHKKLKENNSTFLLDLSNEDNNEQRSQNINVMNDVEVEQIHELINIFTHTAGNVDAWVMLPFLPVLLSRANLYNCQHVLMTFNVLLKSDESQSEVLACMPDRSWIRLLVSCSLIGEITIAKSEESNQNEWQQITSMKSDIPIANTCVELTLDSIAIIMEYKTKHHYNESWSTWNCLQNCIKTSCNSTFGDEDKAELTEIKFLKRIVALVLQRLSKHIESWNGNILMSLVNILTLIENRKLCGNFVTSSLNAILRTTSTKTPLLEFDFGSPTIFDSNSIQTVDESQILSFMIDLVAGLRTAAENGSMLGNEWKALKLSLRICLLSLNGATEIISERIAKEILAQLKYMTEAWAPISGDGFKSIVMRILKSLRSIIEDKNSTDYRKSGCKNLVFDIMIFFGKIRHSIAIGINVSKHIIPMMDILVGVDSCSDIDLIFKLLEVTMRTADSISFEDSDEAMMSGAVLDNVKDIITTETINSEDRDSLKYGSLPEEYLSDVDQQNNTSDDTLLQFDQPLLDMVQNEILNYHEKHLQSNDSIESFTTPKPRLSLVDPPTNTDFLDDKFSTVPPLSIISDPTDLYLVSDILPIDNGFGAIIAQDETPNNSALPTTLDVIGSPSPRTKQIKDEEKTRESNFMSWLKIRQGISTERIDSERARLTRSMDALDLSAEATDKFWKKARRKVETESFVESHKCQWKLGVSHEGHFPGRKRLILRPRYDIDYATIANNDSLYPIARRNTVDEDNMDMKSDELSRALAKACVGYINDVTRVEVVDDKNSNNNLLEKDPSEGRRSSQLPGNGWGLVDADGSEEGFGVVGLDSTASTPDIPNASDNHQDSNPSLQQISTDMMSDVKQIEENYRQGKGVETGPCHSGTRRVGSGPVILESKVFLITASGNFWGNFSFNGKEIFFSSMIEPLLDGQKGDSAAVNLIKYSKIRRRRWVLSSVCAIYLRRFRLRDSSIEIFFRRGKHRNVFVDFGHSKENAKQRNEFARALMAAAPSSAFKQQLSMSPYRLVYEHGVQEKWLSGKLSNFDYLMALNTIAGRSYNDLCQYPVFPWVIADYESDSIDLNDTSVYRDLSKPMGAINEDRLKEFLDRYNSFEDNVTSGIPPFMYGSHYSTMVGVVLHFLVRLQPFAALHKEMQNGHFDVPDRLFSSIPRAFKHNTTQLSEVKELTPEWFTTPEMFRNINRFNLGQTQDGERIDDVELPLWAKSAEDFVRINREALESDYVTEHLHEWIDLIFGYKQRGPDAVEAHNVFYYLTYYGSVNRYMIEDEALRRATELQIAHFGQIPLQLFRTPHPSRKVSGNNATIPIPRQFKKCFQSSIATSSSPRAQEFVDPLNDDELTAAEAACTVVNKNNSHLIISCAIFNDRVICVQDNGILDVLRFATSEEAKGAITAYAATKKSRQPTAVTGSNKTIDIISFDDQNDLINTTTSQSHVSATTNVSNKMMLPTPETPHILHKYEPLIFVEREINHFELVPRILLPKPNKYSIEDFGGVLSTDRDAFEKLYKVKPMSASSESVNEQLAKFTQFSKSGSLAISIGHYDGRIMVREVDTRTGIIKAVGDFRAHRNRVVAFALDTIPFGNTDVVCSVDEAGQILVWTISKVRGNQHTNMAYNYVISRRPQRLFRCEAKADICCDISWQMGIVLVASNKHVNIFSIERDELLRSFIYDVTVPLELPIIDKPQIIIAEGNDILPLDASVESSKYPEYCYTRPSNYIFGSESFSPLDSNAMIGMNDNNRGSIKSISRRVSLSDSGYVVLYVETFQYLDTLLEYEDTLTHNHILLVYTLSGNRTGFINFSNTPVTCLTVPDRDEVIITGQSDGTVSFYRIFDLQPLHSFRPHSYCVSLSINYISSLESITNGKRASKVASNTIGKDPSNNPAMYQPLETEVSPIISVNVGPNKSAPSLIIITTESGNIFLKALPDFIRWEKQRSPSTLAQLANVPIQVVKQHAANLSVWTSETAGVIASNAKSFADDALEEFKK
eukprot:gene5336-7405_t